MVRRNGYLMVEAIVAMGLLSITMVTIHAGMRQAFIALGESEDFTIARFLLEDLMGAIEMQKTVKEDHQSGKFPGEHNRFNYDWRVRKVRLTPPAMPQDMTPEMREVFRNKFKPYVGHIQVTISWNRGGRPYKITGQTVFSPENLWLPEGEEELLRPE